MRITTVFSLLIIILLSVVSCNNAETGGNTSKETKIRVAITKGVGSDSYLRYGQWIQKADTSIVWIDMYHIPLDSALELIKHCDGLLLSGGEDVNPDLHGQISEIDRCGTIDYKRDTLEYALLDYAVNHNMPVMGICRGQQMINVFLGSNLYIDLPTDKPSQTIHRCPKTYECRHKIYIAKGSLLNTITGVDSAVVNSAHHQAVKIPAVNIIPNAWAPDSVIESISWDDTTGRGFLLGVQFHPEHLDFENPVSGKVAKRFVEEVISYHNKKVSDE